MKRFIVEGTWSGYSGQNQQRIVHRQVYDGSRKKLREWLAKNHAIYYTDGTALYLTVRDCKPRERVKELRGYTSLIDSCVDKNVNRVSDLKESA